MKDYYYILGTKRDSSIEEVKKAYKKLALKFHPDQNGGDKFFEERFKDIQEAYEILSDSNRRKQYDISWQIFSMGHRKEFHNTAKDEELKKEREEFQRKKDEFDKKEQNFANQKSAYEKQKEENSNKRYQEETTTKTSINDQEQSEQRKGPDKYHGKKLKIFICIFLICSIAFYFIVVEQTTESERKSDFNAVQPQITANIEKIEIVSSCSLKWIFFDFNKSDLRVASQTELDGMVTILKDNPDFVAVLQANTDSAGADAYNEALSGRRAENSKQYLIAKSISPERIKITLMSNSNGFSQKYNNEELTRQLNRRIELFIQDKSGKNICKSIPPNIPNIE